MRKFHAVLGFNRSPLPNAAVSAFAISFLMLCASVQPALAEVSSFDHLQNLSVTNCKPGSDEKPHATPVGPLCSYIQRLCDVSEGGKSVIQGVQIDIDCVPKETSKCPSIGECAKSRLPEKISDYVKAQNDPNSGGRMDGAGFDIPK